MTYRQPHTGRPALRPGMVPPVLLKRSHASLLREVLDASARIPGVFLFRTGGGAFRVGNRYVKMGTVGTSDLVGWVVTCPGCGCGRHNDDACSGLPVPRFVAIEAKTGRDKLSPAQAVFLQRVRAAGGIAGEVRSAEDALRLLQ